jgi:hypothetical protein
MFLGVRLSASYGKLAARSDYGFPGPVVDFVLADFFENTDAIDFCVAIETDGQWELWIIPNDGKVFDLSSRYVIVSAERPLQMAAGSLSTLAAVPDDHQDLIVCKQVGDTVKLVVYPGLGDGRFEAARTYDLDSTTEEARYDEVLGLQTGDFDGNGADDVLVVLRRWFPDSGGTIALCSNVGTGFGLAKGGEVTGRVATPPVLRLTQFVSPVYGAKGTTFHVEKTVRGSGALRLYDVSGRVVSKIELPVEPGLCSISWNGENTSGGDVASGVYFVAVQAGGLADVKKVVVIR